VEAWADPDAPTLIPPGQWRIYQPGDAAPVYHTAGNQPINNPLSRPFYGSDWILYVDHDYMENYHQGPPLPRGGRAQASDYPERRVADWQDRLENEQRGSIVDERVSKCCGWMDGRTRDSSLTFTMEDRF
jgi:hypothetical protein